MSKKNPPKCTCGVQLTVKHLLTECRQTEEIRIKYNVPKHLHRALGQDEITNKQVLKFIEEIGIDNLL